MHDQQMNRVQRRLWAAFLAAGGDVAEDWQIDRFQRLVHDCISVMPPALSRVMMLVLSSEGELDYTRLAADLAERDQAHLSRDALRQRVSRASRRLEAAIRDVPWKTVPRTAIVFQRPTLASARSRRSARDPHPLRSNEPPAKDKPR